MSYKTIIGGLLLCVLLLSACNMQSEDAGAEISLESATEANTTAMSISTATVMQQPTAVPTQKFSMGSFAPAPTNTQVASNTTACTPQHPEWQQYTVQAGDTLGSIARRVNSDTATLASVNCLGNPDMIAVGTVLRVPQTPATTPIASVPNVPPPVGYAGTPSAAELQGRCFVVRDAGGGGYISVYETAADYYHNPSAVYEGYAEFVRETNGGYEIRVPQRQNNMWITGAVHLEGTDC